MTQLRDCRKKWKKKMFDGTKACLANVDGRCVWNCFC